LAWRVFDDVRIGVLRAWTGRSTARALFAVPRPPGRPKDHLAVAADFEVNATADFLEPD